MAATGRRRQALSQAPAPLALALAEVMTMMMKKCRKRARGAAFRRVPSTVTTPLRTRRSATGRVLLWHSRHRLGLPMAMAIEREQLRSSAAVMLTRKGEL